MEEVGNRYRQRRVSTTTSWLAGEFTMKLLTHNIVSHNNYNRLLADDAKKKKNPFVIDEE